MSAQPTSSIMSGLSCAGFVFGISRIERQSTMHSTSMKTTPTSGLQSVAPVFSCSSTDGPLAIG